MQTKPLIIMPVLMNLTKQFEYTRAKHVIWAALSSFGDEFD